MKRKTDFSQTDQSSCFFPEDNMMLLREPWWSSATDNGVGDALWRTGFAYIAYHTAYFKIGILKCFKEKHDGKRKYLQAYRHHSRLTHGVSRDQIISALVSLMYNGNYIHVLRICLNLKWKLSRQPKKFEKIPWIFRGIAKFFGEARITFDMWLWMKAISTNNKFFSALFSIISIIIVGLSQLWNKLLYAIAGLKVCSPEEQLRFGGKLQNPTGIKKKVFKLHYPAYAYHLFAWQLYVAPNNIFKTICKKMCLKLTDKSNYLLILLFGGKVARSDIENYKPMTGLRWQSIFFKGIYDGTEDIQSHGILNKKYSSEYNVLDNDLLWAIANRHLDKIT